MSRAFTKEDDSDTGVAGGAQRAVDSSPNYVTAQGLAELRAWRDRLKAQLAAEEAGEDGATRGLHRGQIERDLAYVESRLASAIPVDLRRQPRDRVAFGAHVEAETDQGEPMAFRIVGIDEADPAQGKVSYRAPLARAAMGAETGDLIAWERPAGTVELEIVAISYPES